MDGLTSLTTRRVSSRYDQTVLPLAQGYPNGADYPPEVKWIKSTGHTNHNLLPEELLTEAEISELVGTTAWNTDLHGRCESSTSDGSVQPWPRMTPRSRIGYRDPTGHLLSACEA